MFYESVKVQAGETMAKLCMAYGHPVADLPKIWADMRNAPLRALRKTADRVQAGDVVNIPIPWRITKKLLSKQARGASVLAERDGEPGERLVWVQTVYQHNQPVPGTSPFCADGCPADDNEPFYYTAAEVAADPMRSKQFYDYSQRNPPTAKQGGTMWRAILSLALVTGKRVTVWDSLLWGWDMTPANVITTVGPRVVTPLEFSGHLALLREGHGTAKRSFAKDGWTFRAAP